MKRAPSIAALLTCLLLTGFSTASFVEVPISKHRGVCWVAGPKKITEAELAKLSTLNINWISQTPFGWQRSPTSPEIVMHPTGEKIWWGESDEGIAETARLARAQNIKTLLKPHLWVGKGWPGDIAMSTEAGWDAWFSNYEKFILHYAELAERNHIDILCIGTELQRTISREKEWRTLIRKIKSVYHGRITYAANFHLEYETISFWDELDFIGIQAYFPLAKTKDAQLDELLEGWKSPLESIEKVQMHFNKPVIFTEIGYRSTHDAAVEPWQWPNKEHSTQACYEAQAACYRAFFQSVWNKKWFAGVYFWKWYPQGPRRMGSIDFTPQNKPAEKVLLENFSK